MLRFYLFPDNMENWNEEELAEVVEKKHGEQNRSLPKTSIVRIYSRSVHSLPKLKEN